MKRLSYLFSLLSLVSLLAFTGCKDDAPEETKEQKQTRLLTDGTFTVNEVTLNPATDYSFTGPTTITFNEDNNTFSITSPEALPRPANAPDADFTSGNWSWTDTENFDEITLTPASGSGNLVLTVTTLDENSLVFSYEGAEPKPEDLVTVTVTASK